MSKLSKFKYGISPTEAAKLLSRLIGEDVSLEDLRQMFEHGWITVRLDCSATVVKLNPLLDRGPPTNPYVAGICLMEAERECGTCYGFDLPMDQVEIDQSGLAYALMDEEGNHYALRDSLTGTYLNEAHDSHPNFVDSWLDPEEIYELAKLANNDTMVAPPKIKIIEMDNCISDVKLYNFQPGQNRAEKQHILTNKALPQEPPSFIMAVAALAEIATNGKTKKRNQASLIDEILDNYKFRGLSKSNLEKMFSQANRLMTESKAAKD